MLRRAVGRRSGAGPDAGARIEKMTCPGLREEREQRLRQQVGARRLVRTSWSSCSIGASSTVPKSMVPAQLTRMSSAPSPCATRKASVRTSSSRVRSHATGSRLDHHAAASSEAPAAAARPGRPRRHGPRRPRRARATARPIPLLAPGHQAHAIHQRQGAGHGGCLVTRHRAPPGELSPDGPRSRVLRLEPLDGLDLLQRIERDPVAVVRLREQSSLMREGRERRIDQILARRQPIEDLRPEDVTPAVDPHVGTLRRRAAR